MLQKNLNKALPIAMLTKLVNCKSSLVNMKRINRRISSALFMIGVFIFIGSGPPVLAAVDPLYVAAAPVTYTVSLNRQDYRLQSYIINGSAFFRLRDIAAVLSGTTKQFQVEWDNADNAIRIATGKVYHKTGDELTITETDKAALPTTPTIYIDENRTNLTGYCIDESTYLKFTDLADIIGFTVVIDAASCKASISGVQIENYEDESFYVLTLRADNNEALFKGDAVTLSAQPFIQNDIFYIPLEAVTKLLGGTYSFENNVATVELSGVTTKYKIGSRSFIVNGETYVVSGSRYSFSASKDSRVIDDKYAPIISNGVVFIPDQFTEYHCPYNSILSGLSEYPESNMVILSSGFLNEQGIHEVRLLNTYDLLPADFRSQLNYAGVVGKVLNYNIEEYKNDWLEVYVMCVNKPYDDIENMDGKVCTIKVLSNQYSTLRGLKVMDSAYRAWLLYGYENLSESFTYTVNGGLVESLIFRTRYYGSQFGK